MYKLLLPLLILQTNILLASSTHDHDSDNHAYIHKNIDGSNTAIDQNKYNIFVKDLSNVKIAIVDVKGMVCDFCARGIEKTFYDDKSVEKVNVDLGAGKVLVAYSNTKKIDVDEIKNIFLINGQTATNVIIKEL